MTKTTTTKEPIEKNPNEQIETGVENEHGSIEEWLDNWESYTLDGAEGAAKYPDIQKQYERLANEINDRRTSLNDPENLVDETEINDFIVHIEAENHRLDQEFINREAEEATSPYNTERQDIINEFNQLDSVIARIKKNGRVESFLQDKRIATDNLSKEQAYAILDRALTVKNECVEQLEREIDENNPNPPEDLWIDWQSIAAEITKPREEVVVKPETKIPETNLGMLATHGDKKIELKKGRSDVSPKPDLDTKPAAEQTAPVIESAPVISTPEPVPEIIPEPELKPAPEKAPEPKPVETKREEQIEELKEQIKELAPKVPPRPKPKVETKEEPKFKIGDTVTYLDKRGNESTGEILAEASGLGYRIKKSGWWAKLFGNEEFVQPRYITSVKKDKITATFYDSNLDTGTLETPSKKEKVEIGVGDVLRVKSRTEDDPSALWKVTSTTKEGLLTIKQGALIRTISRKDLSRYETVKTPKVEISEKKKFGKYDKAADLKSLIKIIEKAGAIKSSAGNIPANEIIESILIGNFGEGDMTTNITSSEGLRQKAKELYKKTSPDELNRLMREHASKTVANGSR